MSVQPADETQLARGEPAVLGVQRIFTVQVSEVARRCTEAAVTPQSVHEARVTVKRTRAGLRLLRCALQRATFDALDEQLRKLGHHWAPLRDADVLRTTLERVIAVGLPSEWYARLEPHLPQRREIDVEALGRDARAVQSSWVTFAGTDECLGEVPRWTSKRQRKRLLRALQKTYRAGTKKLRLALDSPGAAPPLHDLRKQVKYHANQLSLLGTSKQLKRRKKRLTKLGKLLGEHHDLHQLREHVGRCAPDVLSPEETATLFEQIAAQQAPLEQAALSLACRLYRRKPAKFTAWLRQRSLILR